MCESAAKGGGGWRGLVVKAVTNNIAYLLQLPNSYSNRWVHRGGNYVRGGSIVLRG